MGALVLLSNKLAALIGLFYLSGALCWITNAIWAGWPSPNSATRDAWVLGCTAVLGAALFHLGAVCQVWDSLNNNKQQFTRLPCCVPPEPWLEQAFHRSSRGKTRSTCEPAGLQQPRHSTSCCPHDIVAVLDDTEQQQDQEWHNQSGAAPRAHRFSAPAELAAACADDAASVTVSTVPAAAAKADCPASGSALACQQKQLQQHRAWVWWEWRPNDTCFMAAFVQVVGTSIFAAACVCGSQACCLQIMLRETGGTGTHSSGPPSWPAAACSLPVRCCPCATAKAAGLPHQSPANASGGCTYSTLWAA